MRRWCGGVWWRGLGTSPEKNHFPQNDKFQWILPPFITGRKHGSFGTRILQFSHEITQLTKTVQTLSKNSRFDQRGASHHPPPLSTPLDLKKML